MKFSGLNSSAYVLLWIAVFSTCDSNETALPPVFSDDTDGSYAYKYLHKCSCVANEVWYMNTCQENATAIEGLVDMYSSETKIIETNTIDNIEVGEIICPSPFLNITLPGESFALQTSGYLFNMNYGLSLEFSKYCVEHLYNENNDEIELEVHLCLPVPSVPKCCPDDLYNDFTKTCDDFNITEVVVPFMLGRNSFETVAESFSNILDCHNSENRTFVSMAQSSAFAKLKLTNEGLVLEHQMSVVGDKVFIPSPEYCLQLDRENKNIVGASYCYEDPISRHIKYCKDNTCLRKCCPLDQIYDMDNFKCIHVGQNRQWSPKVYEIGDLENPSNETVGFKIITGFPLNCEFFSLSSNNDPPDIFRLLTNGSLYIDNWNKALPSYQYCADNFKYGSMIVEEAIVCFMEKTEEVKSCATIKEVVYPVLLLISCIFLAVTLLVYAMIPDLHSKIQGKCLIASISSLIVAYIFMAVVQLSSSTLSMGSCIAFGLLMQFSILASFFWLNVMSFDIWRTLRSTKTGRRSPSSVRRRYFLYSLYAWGCPLIITTVTITMQFIPESAKSYNLILPEIGKTDCFFPRDDNRPHWAYYYSFICVTLIINTCIFIHLAYILLRAKQISESTLGKKNQIHKEWAKLYLKLFIIMGITWLFEVASWIEGSCGIWVVTDIVNALRGFLIFIIFVCKKDVISKLLIESTPAFHRMRTTMRQSSSMFSRSSKRTSNFYVDPTSAGTHEVSQSQNENHADVTL